MPNHLDIHVALSADLTVASELHGVPEIHGAAWYIALPNLSRPRKVH